MPTPTPISLERRRRYQALLRAERARLETELAGIKTADHGRSPDGLSAAPGDDGVAGAAGVDPYDDAVIEAHAAAELREIDDALRLLTERPEDYGICIVCQWAIPARRLDLLPATRWCARHAPGRRRSAAGDAG